MHAYMYVTLMLTWQSFAILFSGSVYGTGVICLVAPERVAHTLTRVRPYFHDLHKFQIEGAKSLSALLVNLTPLSCGPTKAICCTCCHCSRRDITG